MMGAVGVAPGAVTIRLPDGRVVALTDWIDQYLFGTVELHTTDTQQVIAFSTGLSQVIPGGSRPSTEVDTNVPRNGDSGLPQDYEFLAYGWGWKLTRATRPNEGETTITGIDTFSDPVNVRTFFEVDRRLFFHYKHNRKDYTEGVIQDYPQGHGMFISSTATDLDIAQNGVPSPRDRIALVIPVHHKMGLSFQGFLQPIVPLAIAQPATDDGDDLTFVDAKLYMYGLLRRPIFQ